MNSFVSKYFLKFEYVEIVRYNLLGKFSEYWVTGQDVAQETEKWAELAALASAAVLPISCPVTQYSTKFRPRNRN